jgi:hypothetical protein
VSDSEPLEGRAVEVRGYSATEADRLRRDATRFEVSGWQWQAHSKARRRFHTYTWLWWERGELVPHKRVQLVEHAGEPPIGDDGWRGND